MSGSVRVLIVGHGRMGKLVESLASEHAVEIAAIVTSQNAGDSASWDAVDVAIDFSTADAVPANARRLAGQGLSLVIGTTGWGAHEHALRDALSPLPVGVIAAPNFAIGVNLFLEIAERSAALLGRRGFAPWIHEAHHAAKKDAPSGTAIALKNAIAPHTSGIDVSSTRAGFIPGTHTVGFDSAAETITLTHVARDRTAFARGALEAAKWIRGRRGWFTMRDMLRDTQV